MSSKTGIQWTDATWNPVVGCTKVSQGCKRCYAKTLHDQRHKAFLAGKSVAPQYALPFEQVQLMPERLEAPLHWRKPRRVFVNSVSDLFHEQVPDEFLDRVFGVIAQAPRHTFQILTKRPERMRAYATGVEALPPRERSKRFVRSAYADHPMRETLLGDLQDRDVGELAWPLPNVWLGTSVENQDAADQRIPLLLETPAEIRFLSCEPLLGPVDILESVRVLHRRVGDFHPVFEQAGGIDWVIVGGESGAGARSCDVRWIRSILAQCRTDGVPVFVKQLGRRPLLVQTPTVDGFLKLKDAHGGDPDEWPAELRVREFPLMPPLPVGGVR